MGKLTTRGVQKLVREAKPGLTNDGEGLYLKIGKKGGKLDLSVPAQW